MAVIKYETTDRVATLTLDRPDQRNSLNDELVRALADAFERAGGDDRVRALVLTGAGKSFCAGADLKQLQSMADDSASANLADSRRLADLLTTVSELSVPVIARVNGDALGGGAGLVLAADWAFAVEDARIGFPEVRLGFVPAVVLPFLLRAVGERTARDLTLRGHRLSAREAKAAGLFTHVLADDTLDDAVYGLADEIACETSGSAVAVTKRLLHRMPHLSLEEAVDLGVTTNAYVRQTDDYRAGISAFLSEEAPPWRVPGSE